MRSTGTPPSWTLPPERMKRQREHTVPLSAPAIALLRRLEAAQTGNYVFPGNEAVIGHTGIWDAVKELSDGKATVHGFEGVIFLMGGAPPR